MGKGDKKSKRGKIFRGSFGKSRPRKTKAIITVPAVKDEKETAESSKTEKVKTEKKKTTKKKSAKKETTKKETNKDK